MVGSALALYGGRMACELRAYALTDDKRVEEVLDLIQTKADGGSLTPDGRRFDFMAEDAELSSVKPALAKQLDRETPGWRVKVRF